MRALIVEDDAIVAETLRRMMQSEDIACETTDSGEDGLEIAKLYEFDVMVLDLNLPDMNGHDLLRRLRAANVDVPVLILSGCDETESKVRGLRNGADDYLTKPFQKAELLARLNALTRRARGHADPVIRIGGLAVDTNAKSVSIGGRMVPLTPKEYSIVELLAVRKGAMVSKDAILDNLYNGIDEPGIKIIDVFVCKLRKKLSAAADGVDYITTVWGRGFMLKEPASDTAEVKLVA